MHAPLISAGRADQPGPKRGERAGRRWTYRLFGLTVSSGFRLPGLVAVRASGPPMVTLDIAERSAVEAAFSGPPALDIKLVLGRGRTVDVVLGRRADRLLTLERQAVFHVGPRGETVLCAPADLESSGWQQVLLDTVLGTAALAHGYEALHAGAAILESGVVAIASPSGGGKSTLCAELVARGAGLFADDLVFLERRASGVVAHPGPPLMRLPVEWSGDGRLVAEVLDVDAEETWIALPRPKQEPARLLAVLVLDRYQDAGEPRVEPSHTALDLHLVALHSVLQPDRRRARFELLADLAEQTPVRHLVADPATHPRLLAELVESTARSLARA